MLPVLLSASTATFPDYADPRTASPPLFGLPPPPPPDEAPACSVTLFDATPLDNYNLIATSDYAPPGDAGGCPPGSWARVVLRWRGAVQGVQFDRYGALWLGGVELLRTTTPEPDPSGITWAVTKDVTEYAEHLKKSGMQAAVTIPNVVDDTYTGVINITAVLDFYPADDDHPPPESFPEILPVFDALAEATKEETTPWSVMSATADLQSVSGNVTSPVTNAIRGYLDLYASAHSCEEFWYSNPPNASNLTDECAGGAHRQLEVRINGQVAGIANPFPVIYTGGVNPMLWRPLTGILSFDIPAYRFDITPFLGLFNSGAEVNITLGVTNGGVSTCQSVWYLDAVMLLYKAPECLGELLEGDPTEVDDSGANDVTVTPVRVTDEEEIYVTRGKRTLTVTGSLVSKETNQVIKSKVTSSLETFNRAKFTDTASIASGRMYSKQSSSCPTTGAERTIVKEYPYKVISVETTDDNSFDLIGNVTYGRRATASLHKGGPQMHTTGEGNAMKDALVAWTNEMQANARYNRSLQNHSDVNIEYGHTGERYTLAVRSLDTTGYSGDSGDRGDRGNSGNSSNAAHNDEKTKKDKRSPRHARNPKIIPGETRHSPGDKKLMDIQGSRGVSYHLPRPLLPLYHPWRHEPSMLRRTKTKNNAECYYNHLEALNGAIKYNTTDTGSCESQFAGQWFNMDINTLRVDEMQWLGLTAC
uniref:Peptide N-acetyl-beta-D-glucosaminyl asparaginase amidase A N-terminal domain-containing protein n=1 Tax=Lotharella globosa TaxID=91324 RepID=A0A7S3YYC9_9EUKA